MILQGVAEVRDVQMNGNVRAIGGRDMVFEGKRDLHSAAGKGLR